MDKENYFSPAVSDKLKCYVYRLIDPRNGTTFYVGRGRGNRVFSHAAGNEKPTDSEDDESLTRFIHDHEDTKGLFCYKHVVETVFVRAREAFACLTIAQHSVCCSPIFFSSRPCCSSI